MSIEPPSAKDYAVGVFMAIGILAIAAGLGAGALYVTSAVSPDPAPPPTDTPTATPPTETPTEPTETPTPLPPQTTENDMVFCDDFPDDGFECEPGMLMRNGTRYPG